MNEMLMGVLAMHENATTKEARIWFVGVGAAKEASRKITLVGGMGRGWYVTSYSGSTTYRNTVAALCTTLGVYMFNVMALKIKYLNSVFTVNDRLQHSAR